MKILILSPYNGGSHKAWSSGYARHSDHSVQILGLPARYWKWRLHGGAVTLARLFEEARVECDLIVATDMLDLSTFLALTRPKTAHIPAVLYMHENQLTYPLPADGTTGPMRRQAGERDHHYAFVNFSSMLAADRVLFNSEYHLRSFFEALPRFLRHFPEYREMQTIDDLRYRSSVLGVGIEWPETPPGPLTEPPLILWNQRWEYDKNPATFFGALYRALDRDLDFRVALCGESFSRRPGEFEEAERRLGSRIIHKGFADQKTYRMILDRASIVISTAHHEFFGISILEAVAHRTFPILPERLSYPDLVPGEFHESCLYRSESRLDELLSNAIESPSDASRTASLLRPHILQFSWQELAPRYDSLFAETAS